jgi:transposase
VIAPAPATFVWAIPNQRAIWFYDATFDAAGTWAAVVTVTPPDQPDESSELGLTVTTTGLAVRVGAKVPAVPTPTSARAGGVLASTTTDTSPDPRFYQLSEDQALAQHKPFVLVFATPAFCTSRDCGPTLDAVKAGAKCEPAMTFIHIEPHLMHYGDGSLQPILDAMLFIGRTGCQWHYLPERYGPWTAVWAQWQRWRTNGVWARAMTRLVEVVRWFHDREPLPSMVMVDAQTVKGARYGPTFHQAGGRGGRTIGTKRTLLVEILGLPVAAAACSARPHDVVAGRKLLRERAMFWVGVAAVVAVIGGFPLAISLALDMPDHRSLTSDG